MTLYHFGNCVALMYAPYHMAYKFSGMSEYGAWWRCVQAGALYLLTALAKMLLLATFFPDGDLPHNTHEFLKATVDYADLLGLYVALSSVPGKGHAKIFTAAIGWSAAQVLCEHGVELWVGARGAEFSWRWLLLALSGGSSLLEAASAAGLLWLWGRTDLPRARLALGPLLLLPHLQLLCSLAGGPGLALALRTLYSGLCALLATGLYAVLAQQIGF